ncbi:hypothetical protein [Microvirga sp. 2TAF3]|uniref:hypothetical protein n=1 Tax=Microvirga sp. 2TAF3 TaxID=3233014 RepID=UPI003F95B582
MGPLSDVATFKAFKVRYEAFEAHVFDHLIEVTASPSVAYDLLFNASAAGVFNKYFDKPELMDAEQEAQDLARYISTLAARDLDRI